MAVLVDIVSIVPYDSSTSGQNALTTIRVNDIAYEAASQLDAANNYLPLIVFDMHQLVILAGRSLPGENAFHIPQTMDNFTLVNGATYTVKNSTTKPILFGILNWDPSPEQLVNSKTNGGTQTGTLNFQNMLTLNAFQSVTFTLDTSVFFPSLITVTEPLLQPPPVGCCPSIECQTA